MMKTRQWLLIGVLVLLGPLDAWGMSIDARIACALDLERAKWQERGASAADAAARVSLETVRPSVERGVAREQWLAAKGRRISVVQVQAEIERMVAGSRAPEALRRRFEALGNDPVRVAECLARPLLVNRLWVEAGRPEVRSLANEVPPLAPDGLTLPAVIKGTPTPLPNTWRSGGGSAQPRTGHAAIWTGAEVLVLGGAAAGVPPQAFDPATDSWRDLPSSGLPAVDWSTSAVWTGSEVLVWGGRWSQASDEGARWTPGDAAWAPMTSVGAPSARRAHSGVWSGQALIVWGGRTAGGASLQDGAAYDPVLDAWTPLASLDAPAPRYAHAAVWTGDRMLVWGGGDGGQSGGSYDPSTDAWSALTEVDAPAARILPQHVWTGSAWIVGGSDTEGAARFDPVGNTWTAIAQPAEPFTSLAWVWTGSALFAWGYDPLAFEPVAIAATYAPGGDAWTPQDVTGAPELHVGASVTAAGSEVVIWGGEPFDLSGSPLAVGGRWNGASWTPVGVGAAGEPSARFDHVAVWTGAEMLVWGGADAEPGAANALGDGGAYDPATDAWRPLSALGAPSARTGHAAVWTGSAMLVWGGEGSGGVLGDGAAYDPVLDSWTALSPTDAPAARVGHHAVWTGAEMLIVGGGGGGIGARYRPDLDSWTPMDQGPEPGQGASVVWAGDRLLLWGGDPFWSAEWVPDGGNGSDTWAGPLAQIEPSPRRGHAAIWTGEEMVIAGGVGVGQSLVGSTWRYRPGSGWISEGGFWFSVGAPAVWTGTEVVAWGGLEQTGIALAADGLRHNVLDWTWYGVTPDGAPPLRQRHSLVWTGEEALVWGGADENGTPLASLGAYTPAVFESLVSITGITPANSQEIGLSYSVTVEVDGVAPPLDGSVVVDDGAAGSARASCVIALPQTQCSLTSTEPGDRPLRARFSGDDLHRAASVTQAYSHARAATVTAIFAIDPNADVQVGQPYEVYVSITGRPGLSGTVEIDDGEGNACSFDVQTGGSRCALASTTPGQKVLTARYSGDTLNAPSEGTAAIEISAVPLPDGIFEDGFEVGAGAR